MHAILLAHIQTAASVPHGAAATGGSVIAAALASIAVLLLPFGIALFIACQAPAPGRSDDGDIDSGGRGAAARVARLARAVARPNREAGPSGGLNSSGSSRHTSSTLDVPTPVVVTAQAD